MPSIRRLVTLTMPVSSAEQARRVIVDVLAEVLGDHVLEPRRALLAEDEPNELLDDGREHLLAEEVLPGGEDRRYGVDEPADDAARDRLDRCFVLLDHVHEAARRLRELRELVGRVRAPEEVHHLIERGAGELIAVEQREDLRAEHGRVARDLAADGVDERLHLSVEALKGRAGVLEELAGEVDDVGDARAVEDGLCLLNQREYRAHRPLELLDRLVLEAVERTRDVGDRHVAPEDVDAYLRFDLGFDPSVSTRRRSNVGLRDIPGAVLAVAAVGRLGPPAH